jgi:hypothetical protein
MMMAFGRRKGRPSEFLVSKFFPSELRALSEGSLPPLLLETAVFYGGIKFVMEIEDAISGETHF